MTLISKKIKSSWEDPSTGPDFMGTFLHTALTVRRLQHGILEDPNKDEAYISQCKSQGDINKCFWFQTCYQWAFPYLCFIKGTDSSSCLRRASVSGFGPFLSVLVFSVSPRLSHPLALRCALHFPDVSDGLRREVSIYTVILYLLDEHICLLQGPHS